MTTLEGEGNQLIGPTPIQSEGVIYREIWAWNGFADKIFRIQYQLVQTEFED